MINSKITIEEEVLKRNYSKDEIKEIVNKVLNREMKIGVESHFIENEVEVRVNAYNSMKVIVESKLEKGEEIFLSKINIPFSSGAGWVSICMFYQGLFFTNKRVFIFNLNYKYEEVEALQIKKLDDIKELIDKSQSDGMRIDFKDSDRVFIKSYSEDENKLTLIIAKFLLERGIKFSQRNKTIETLFN